MSKIINNSRNEYLVVRKDFLQNKKIGLSGIGLLVTLLSLPDDCTLTVEKLAAEVSEEKTAVEELLKKLQAEGYVSADEDEGITVWNVSDRQMFVEEMRNGKN
jgi:DNA-binding MarR family transcriptional regulator